MMRPFSCAVCALNALQNSMMLTPCWPSAGPTGGAGFACPPGICSLMSVRTFFAICLLFRAAWLLLGVPDWSPARNSGPDLLPLVDLLHLVEPQLHRNLALEDVHEHLQLLLLRVHLHDLAVEVGERS